MPHTRRKKKNQFKVPKNYTPIETSHCNVNQVAKAIVYQIKVNWMSRDEFDIVYNLVQERLENDV